MSESRIGKSTEEENRCKSVLPLALDGGAEEESGGRTQNI